jgi:hypothetical protein
MTRADIIMLAVAITASLWMVFRLPRLATRREAEDSD